ncbi:MAG TPA: M28 family peptidase [Solirubrobacteraceae bacterium]|jgi:hypothetical protein
MRPLETITGLADVTGRGPGTDAERRAARWLAGELAGNRRHRVRVETFWCRPNWALAHAWHVALALVGSLVAVGDPTIGATLLGVALISTAADATVGVSLGRRLTRECASQNVLASTPAADHTAPAEHTPPAHGTPTTTLIVTANYNAGRTGLIYRDPLRKAAAGLRRLTGGVTPGWLGWLTIAIAWLTAIAVIRTTAHHASGALGVIQLPPTVALVLALALLLEAAASGYGPAAGDNAAGTAAAIALVRALAAAPPRNLAVELVLQGAGDGEGLGLKSHLRTRRKQLNPRDTIVLGIAACGAGEPRWWQSDGRFIPIRYSRPLRALCAEIADKHPHTNAAAHRARGAAPALPARARRIPAIAIGALDPHDGLAPNSHQPSDTIESIDSSALQKTVEFGLLLGHAIDQALEHRDESATAADREPTQEHGQDHEHESATPA